MRQSRSTQLVLVVIAIGVGCSPEQERERDYARSSAKLTRAPDAEAFKTAAACPTCEVLAVGAINVGDLDVGAYSAKLLDRVSGQRRLVTLRADGSVDDADRIRAEDKALGRARRGVLTRGLQERAAAAPASAVPVKLYFWAGVGLEYPRKEDPEAVALFEATADAKVQAKTAPLVASLRARGYEITNEGKTSPLVEALALLPRIYAARACACGLTLLR